MSKNIKKELRIKVSPRTDKIKIKNIRQTKTKSVVKQFKTRSDLQKFKDFRVTPNRRTKEKSSPKSIQCGQFNNS